MRTEFPPPRGRDCGGGACPLLGAALSPDGTRLATVSGDGALSVWDAAKGTALRTIDLGEHGEGVAWAPDGTKLVALVQRTPSP